MANCKFSPQLFYFALLVLWSLPTSAAQGGTPSFNELGLNQTNDLRPNDYSIESVQFSGEPGFLKFHVKTPHAEYDAEGLMPLKKLLREIEVIEKVRTGEVGTGFTEGAVDSVKATGQGLANLVSNPVDSAKGIGKATGKLGKKIGGVFRKKEEGEKSSFGEKFLGGAEREIANELGVDVYTTNPYLKEMLSKMARSRMGGKGVAAIGKFLIPVAGVVSLTLSASGVNSAADQFVNSNARIDIYEQNKKALIEMGFPEREVKEFLNNEFYSPRESTYLRFYLYRLKGIPGYQKIFEKARGADSLWQARKILYCAQIAVDAAQAAKNERLDWDNDILFLAQDTKVILITPYDYLESSVLGEKILKSASEAKRSLDKSSAEIWNGGKVATAFSLAAFAQGIKTNGGLLKFGGKPND